ncbi:hypothetical protein LAZ67_6002647 [Cordylochernes scorpioides]|uniref:DDT domain-containing protein n=1 Tax=Cordylochernes scorpioides TaxID=51811 RepID=A0ABY6KJZ5_9ARAC|nr:hypothetical protein LAZ67_6002647 [Cordylochernes scorpioides]
MVEIAFPSHPRCALYVRDQVSPAIDSEVVVVAEQGVPEAADDAGQGSGSQREQEERERQRRKVMEEIQRKQALQREQQELDYIVYRELQNQVEDMMVKNALPLPQLAPLSCRRLSGEPFSKLLMVFEFIYNFGETLGFDVSQLPGLTTLQEGILNVEPKAEEDLLLVLQHLLVCVIDDQGYPPTPPSPPSSSSP